MNSRKESGFIVLQDVGDTVFFGETFDGESFSFSSYNTVPTIFNSSYEAYKLIEMERNDMDYYVIPVEYTVTIGNVYIPAYFKKYVVNKIKEKIKKAEVGLCSYIP